MPFKPTVSFFLSGTDHPVSSSAPLWNRALPRTPDRHDPDTRGDGFTYGRYFQAVSDFLLKKNGRILMKAVSDGMGQTIPAEEVRHLDIFLEKHGACYHPARVAVQIAGTSLNLVVNGAVSDEGKAMIGREYQSLARLARETALPFTPKVYGLDRMSVGTGVDIPMFLGQWFQGFSEFHLFPDPVDGHLKIKVWDSAGPYFLAPDQTKAIYRQAALILASYYHIETFEQVMAWHHAAGDFVVRPLAGGRVDLRLITVRDYAPLMSGAEADAGAMVEGLILFLLGMTIRMRIDRVDGVGETVWADDAALSAAMTGFFDALVLKEVAGAVPEGFAAGWFRHLAAYSAQGLGDLGPALLAQYPAGSPDREMAAANLAAHAAGVRRFALEIAAAQAGARPTR
jgi:hypothetical protein